MTGYFIRRLLLMIPTLFGIMLVSFVVVQFAPGGPVDTVARITAQTFKVASAMPPVPAAQIVGSRDGSFYINKGQAAGLKVGQRFAVQHVVDEIKDADGKVLDRVTKQTGVLEVTQVLANSAIAKVVSGTAAQGDSVEAQ